MDADAAVITALNVAIDATALNAYAVAALRRVAHDLASAGVHGAKDIEDSPTSPKR
ncbi:hypothetical protein [Nonomuraea sp. NEAU-A123]|uniref:hypothetical protein n=1 Tax=Nonomuraea sp. NEAU-A123 TaxID=2839649 RepID=UPI001BE4B7EB|nr:hypothetical protein [Nonomuraea sp. NEAU-A123]MBT2231663.1 hypothetical protein [Nonomuraea sp. NEAU-A123]